MDFTLIIAVIGLFSSFLFSGAETALTSLGRLEIDRLSSQGGKNAKLIQYWKNQPNTFLIVVLIGNNIANIGASSLVTIWATQHFPDSVPYIMGALTFFVILFMEIFPKVIARTAALQLAPTSIRFLLATRTILWPVIVISERISTYLARLFGFNARFTLKPLSEDELTHTIEIATQEGGIDKATGEALSNLIDFPERIARDIMTPRSNIQAVSIRWSHDEVSRMVSFDGHSRYPVIRDSMDDVVGFLLVKDLLAHIHRGAPGSWTRVVRKAYFVSEVAPLGTILRDMKRWGTHLALVRNETGVLTGLLTLEDLIEEIVGEIRDEHDDPAPAPEDNLGGPVMVSGEIAILDFNDRFNVSLPLDISYSTLNGYILSKCGGHLPPEGTLIFADDVSFRISSVAENGIPTLEVIPQSAG